MKKTFIAGLFILAILVTAPFFTGWYMEKQYYKMLPVLGDEMYGFFKYTNVNYERGWFSSKATTRISLSFFPAEEFNFEIDHVIGHGPIAFAHGGFKLALAASKNHLKIPAELEADFEEKFGFTEPPQFSHTLSFFSGNHFQFVIPEFEKMPDLKKFSQATFDYVIESETKKYGSFEWPGLVSDQANSNELIKVSNVSYSFEDYKESQFLWLGKEQYRIDNISFIKSPQQKAEFNNMSYLFEVGEGDTEQELMTHALFKMGKSTISDNVEGFSFIIDSIELELNTNRINKQSISKMIMAIITSTGTLVQSQLDEVLYNTQYNFMEHFILAATGMTVLYETAELIKHEPEITIPKLKAVTSLGTLEGDMRISIKSFDLYYALADPTIFYNSVSGHMNLRIPKSFIPNNKIPSEFIELIQNGYITTQADYYIINAEIERGGIRLNGKLYANLADL